MIEHVVLFKCLYQPNTIPARCLSTIPQHSSYDDLLIPHLTSLLDQSIPQTVILDHDIYMLATHLSDLYSSVRLRTIFLMESDGMGWDGNK